MAKLCFVLIESDWNLKYTFLLILVCIWDIINIIRLEFKEGSAMEQEKVTVSINRIRLEFKVATSQGIDVGNLY